MSDVVHPVAVSATALVLAGGRSSRFGSNKLGAELDGRPLLAHVLQAATAVCPQTLVVGPAGGAIDVAAWVGRGVEPVEDERPYEGPLAAAVAAAAHAHGSRALLLGGDMPWVVGDVLRRLLDYPEGRDGGCLLLGEGRMPIPLALERHALLGVAADLVAGGERSLRALVRALDLEVIPEAEWRRLDPDGVSLRDVDRPEDL